MSPSSQLHDQHARETLRLIGPDPEDWVVARPGIDHNVLIVGGGQTGAAFAFALRRAGIGRVDVIDAAPDATRAGVWTTYARMNRLRTPKTLPGPEAGLPALSFQAWHEARHGEASYADIERIGRGQWAEYLAWYRQFLGIAVRYGTTLTLIEPTDAHFRLHLTVRSERGLETRVETARKIILGNGVVGNGRPNILPPLAGLPPSHLAHTSDAIDFAALAGKSVAVIGGAASAFDAAATALEAGARDVHLFVRRARLPAVPVSRARAYPGAYDNFPALPDALRWRQALRFRRAGSTAPADAVQRVTRFANFHLHLGAPWHEAAVVDQRVQARAADGDFEFDFVIAGTGYAVDLHARPELARIADHVLLWRDRYQPAPEERDDALGAHPYLGDALEYLEKQPGAAPFLKNIHVFNPAGFVSRGVPVGDVPCMKRDIPAVVRRISQDLFLEDLDAHEARMSADVPADFDASLYEPHVYRERDVEATE
ncbi:NAD(P)-binding domain-containing protein [Paraburkholderia sp. MMS20-SJTN17]|uniref:NAD(P)-binding domain-containing protein n=1 Tax=Paraburkholderia translucens TaxID=2886945 RepID=A0ABS8KBW0_9BURK|nr:NAD(P)-binding domain-containing protein [Paraburkholderia sp. MMS20-SJTN17]MCC8402259.1 NAD(P)-binding domain-containing protein [Paraburkholderia sp. MMS20-SJTN17]